MKLFFLLSIWWLIGAYGGWRTWGKKTLERLHDGIKRSYDTTSTADYVAVWGGLVFFGFLGVFGWAGALFMWLDKVLDKKS